jgi:hypothetical protein
MRRRFLPVAIGAMAAVFVLASCHSHDAASVPSQQAVVTVAPAVFTQGVGLTNVFTATVTGATNNSVTWSVNDIPGGDNATVGGISTGGRYYAPDNVPVPATVTVKATSVEDPSVSGTAQVTIISGNGTGLTASYTGLPDRLEGPIFHGYWTDCAGTANNMYQGKCAPVADSPVDWAWGSGWTATWSGQLFVPFTGDYYFTSWYWVDGIVYVSVNNTVVADINTPGGGYGKTLTLQGNTWVPVAMSFQSNLGSNNMHLGWVSPGGEWRPVAKSYLKP